MRVVVPPQFPLEKFHLDAKFFNQWHCLQKITLSLLAVLVALEVSAPSKFPPNASRTKDLGWSQATDKDVTLRPVVIIIMVDNKNVAQPVRHILHLYCLDPQVKSLCW